MLALAFVALQAHAQTVPIAVQVQRLAPQLLAFAGSQANFESLVNGLALGVPVTLTTIGPGGLAQTVTFTPASTSATPADIARTLEAARQQLIASGVAIPSAEQLGSLLAGAPLPVTITPTAPAAAAGGTVPSPAAQAQQRGQPSLPPINTSDTLIRGNTSDSPVPSTPPVLAPAPAPAASPSLPPPNARVR
jgi:hypothetical protein